MTKTLSSITLNAITPLPSPVRPVSLSSRKRSVRANGPIHSGP
jgi:hypothetical protein